MLKKPEEMPVGMSWLGYGQLKSLYEKDKRTVGFREGSNELEEILLNPKKKKISLVYKLLLKWFTMDEQVKTQMI